MLYCTFSIHEIALSIMIYLCYPRLCGKRVIFLCHGCLIHWDRNHQLVYLHNYYKSFSFRLGFIAFISSGVTGYMQFIPHARVPVLQYVSNRFGVSCDISINNFAGRIKSKIFYWLNTLDERFGDMVTVPHDLTNKPVSLM